MSRRTFKVTANYEVANPEEGMSVFVGEVLEELTNSDAATEDEFVLVKKQKTGAEGYVPFEVLQEMKAPPKLPAPPGQASTAVPQPAKLPAAPPKMAQPPLV